jgi:hypothetical protein
MHHFAAGLQVQGMVVGGASAVRAISLIASRVTWVPG